MTEISSDCPAALHISAFVLQLTTSPSTSLPEELLTIDACIACVHILRPMKQLPTPPASRQSSEVPDTDLKQLHIDDPTPDLLESLDALLEKYLHLLDKHQRLQHVLASKLSSVYSYSFPFSNDG
jgi:hypothetical protein